MPLIKTYLSTGIQPTLGVVNSGQSGRNAYANNGGYIFSRNLPTSQQPDTDEDDMMSKLSQGSDSVPMLPKANILTTDCVETLKSIVRKKLRSIVLKADLNECLLSISPERSFNPDIDQTDEEGCTSLYKAASNGHLMRVKFLVANGANPNQANKDGRRALHGAAEEGHEDIVKLLVKQGADVDAECGLGQTALHAAVHNNQYLSALFLSLNGADIYKRDIRGRTPLHMAAAAGNIHIFKILVHETWDINVEDDMGLTVLHHAVRNGHSNIVNYLLEKGAEETPYGGDSLLFASASFGSLDLVKLFISRGGKVNEENSIGQNPLHVAALKGYLDIAKCLVEEGCDINKEDHEDFTPVHGAVLNGHLDVLDYLVTQQAKITKYDGKGVLHLAAIHGHLNILRYFIKMGADASELDVSGQTPLHVAARGGHLGVVKYLIEQGSKIGKQDHRGYAPLHIAAAKGRLETVKYLADKNCHKKEFDNTGSTPLALAAIHGHLDTVKYLADGRFDETASLYGAVASGHLDIVRFFMNRISLHLAASHDDLDNVRYLVHQGFDINGCDEKGWTPLEYAIKNSNCEVIDYLLANGAKANQCKEESLLYMASRLGHLDAVNVLISRGISVNAESHRGQIPLHAAAATGRIQVVETLIENGSDLNKTDIDGWTPLHAAVQNGHLEVVRYLMWKGAIDIKCRGMTSLHIAAQSGHFDIVKHLNHGVANVNDEDNLGRIPLHSAAMKGDIELVHYLVEQGSDVNKGDSDGWTPMHEALQSGNLFIVQYLLEKGAKLTKFRGRTPLSIASSAGHLDIVDLLLCNDADVNEDNGTGRIPLHAAAANGSLEIVEKLINHGSNVNKMADNGWAPLHAAVCGGKVDVVRYLICNGATKTGFKGMTVLYIAAQHGYTHLVNYFAMTGCDVNGETHNGKSPLLAASYNGDMDSVEMLVTQGACINQADRNEWTPVHAAAQEGHLPVVTYLVENGADTNAKDADGMTPLQAAEDGGHEDVKQFLIRLKADVKDELHKDTKKTDGITSLQAAEDAGHEDGQKIIIRLRAEVQDERHNDTEKCLRLDGNCQEVFRGSGISKVSACDRLSGTNGESCYHMSLGVHEVTVPVSTQNSWRMSPDSLSRHIKTTIRPTRESGVAKPKPLLPGGEVPATDDLPITSENDAVDPKPGTKNLGYIITTTLRYTRLSCISIPKTQLHGGEVPDTDDFPVTGMTNENDAVNPKSGIKSEHRNNTNCFSILTLLNRVILALAFFFACCPIRVSCVSKPKIQLHGGEVPATDDLPITSENDAVDPKPGIKSERRNNDNCFSIPTLLHQAILALVFYFACFPILVAGNLRLSEPVTLEAGTRGVVTFYLERPSSTLQFSLFYTIQFESKRRPFCIDGLNEIDGFKEPAQVSRFTTTVADKDTSACVNMTIDNVDTVDEDRYILTGVWHSLENVLYDTQKKEVVVQRPPGPAYCSITLSDSEYPYEVHCWAKTGSKPTILTCFQNDRDLAKVHNITDNGHTTRGIFFLPDITHFSCCSHDITSTVGAATCNDFEWPPGHSGIPSTEKNTCRGKTVSEQSNRPADPTPQTYADSDVGSGARRSFMVLSHWHFLYLLMYLLAVVIMC
ncbi:serine/threonine-protein phosphatase 6 regulatory ankyrin repeat subunit B-like [Lytechinus pictus]|uniref:serine/threonine-protein phosphatase 6 regulatory ankyrin repeat subunit B-like n=1 Tax=Lytechinus pictus TaxID=7653 RepID=UPI0030B9DDF4